MVTHSDEDRLEDLLDAVRENKKVRLVAAMKNGKPVVVVAIRTTNRISRKTTYQPLALLLDGDSRYDIVADGVEFTW